MLQWLAVSASRCRVQTLSTSSCACAASRSRAASSARWSPRSARPWTASRRVSSSGSSSRAASASRSTSESSLGERAERERRPVADAADRVGGELDQRRQRRRRRARPPSANATASRTSGSSWVALGEQPGLAVRRAEVAEGARDRREHLGVVPRARPSRSAPRPARPAAPARPFRAARARRRPARAPRARRRRPARPSRRAPRWRPAGRQRAHVRLPLVVAVGPLGPRPLEQLAQLAAGQRRVQAEVHQRGIGAPAQPVRRRHRAPAGRPDLGQLERAAVAVEQQPVALRCGRGRRRARAVGARPRRRGERRPGTCRRAAAAASRCAGAARGSCARPPAASASGPARARAAPILCA